MNTVGVFHLPLTGGEEMMIVDLPQLDSFGDWTVTREGLYFIHRYDGLGKPAAHPSIDFFNFATRRTVTVVPLKQDPTSNPGLSVSLDGRWLIYSNDDFRSLDINLVENFPASVDNNSVTEDIR